MTVLKKGVTPDKTKIQIEDWSRDMPRLHAAADVVAAYPVAMRSAIAKGSMEYPKMYNTFRLALKFKCANDAEKAFQKLSNGSASLLDYEEHMEEKKYASVLSFEKGMCSERG